jgi:hypothetical protein
MDIKLKEVKKELRELVKLSISINNNCHVLDDLEYNSKAIKESTLKLHESTKEVLEAIKKK